MKSRMIFASLVTVALVMSWAAVGNAGGGGAGVGGVPLFQCYTVEHGTAPGQILDMNDQFINPTTEHLGKPAVICTPASATVLNGLDINAATADGDHIICYNVPGGATATRSNIQTNDAFQLNQALTVNGEARLVCVLAEKTCLSGCPVVGP
jgi:hypothetical protein